MNGSRTADLQAEATRRFLGRGGVAGIARSGCAGLTIFLESADAPDRQAILDWAGTNDVDVQFLVSGRFDGTVPTE